MKRLGITSLAAALVMASPAAAMPVVDVYQGTLGAFSFSVVGNTITIEETWINTNPVFLRFTGLDPNTSYTVVKNITNNSGANFITFANELFDPAGNRNDDLDPMQPAFIPAGWTTSNDSDGLSFAQGLGIPRNSDAFGTVVADENSDARDFLDFVNGNVANGGSFFVTYGLTNTSSVNDPFLLGQRANVRTLVPEPSTWALLILGFGAVGGAMRRKRVMSSVSYA